MKQVIGKLRTVIERDAVFEVADDVDVENTFGSGSMIREAPGSCTWITPSIAVNRGLARVVFDGGITARGETHSIEWK